MTNIYLKILAVLLIFAGEAFSILAEMKIAKHFSQSSNQFLPILLKMLLIFLVAGGFLVVGYMFGFKAFKNIWIVSVISITSILIMEPLLAWLIFYQLPTRGALIGLILGTLGFLSALFL